MTTGAFITHLQRFNPSWSRVDLLAYVNDVQNLIYSVATDQMRIIDTTTGKDPKITTTDGVYAYTLDSSTIGQSVGAMIVGNIYTDPDSYSDTIYGLPVLSSGVKAKVQNGDSGSDAYVIFLENPSTSDYYIQCYSSPTQLLSEGVQLTLPSQYHVGYLDKGVLGILEFAHGKSDKYDEFLQSTLVSIRRGLSSQAHNLSHTVSRWL